MIRILTDAERAEIAALDARGWSVSAIARHTGRDRKTVRRSIAGDVTRSSRESCLAPISDVLRELLAANPHVPATELYQHARSAGFDRSYVTFARELRRLGIRPRCADCVAVPAHAALTAFPSPGDEIHWAWLDLPTTPWDQPAHVLIGVLAFSLQSRAVICSDLTFAQLCESVDGVLRRLGGTTRTWWLASHLPERYASDAIAPRIAQLARHYGANVVYYDESEASTRAPAQATVRYVRRSWWQHAPAPTLAHAQSDLDRWSMSVSDRRRRNGREVGVLRQRESLIALPPGMYPAQLVTESVVGEDALVPFEGNRYGVSSRYIGETVSIHSRAGSLHLEIHSATGRRLARHRRAPIGAGRSIVPPRHLSVARPRDVRPATMPARMPAIS